MKHIKIAFFVIFTALFINACQKEYSVESSGLVVRSGTWQFNDSNKLFAGNMDSAYIENSTSLNTKILHLLGTSLDGTQRFNMQLYADTFKTGSYRASLFQSTFSYTFGGNSIYQASQLIGEFTVNVTSFTSTSISGTFSGSALISGTNVVSLSKGKFTSTYTQGAGSGNIGSSSGVLGDSSGNCKPVVIAGVYTPGTVLTAANTVQVQVTVAKAGTYSISTNDVNGIKFSKTGTFNATGLQTVVLTGSGTPVSSGKKSFTVNYGNSQCDFAISFETVASGALGGGGASCTPFSIAGVYQQGIALNATNTVQIQVMATSSGGYSITTNDVNGVTFSATGYFVSPGSQTVTLNGNGTPVNAGPQNFAVTFGNSTCSFSLTFLAGVAPSNDYFPLSLNSYWIYGLVGGTAPDSIHTSVIGYAPTFGSNTYNTIAAYNQPPLAAYDSAYYRKPGGDYYQYAIYSNDLPIFDQPVAGEYIFLKDNVAVGTTWSSPNITGTASGIPITANIKMTILEKGAVTLGTFNFPDVIKVKYEYFLAGSPTSIQTGERWFAKNVGEIYQSVSNNSSVFIYNISDWRVY
jgi:hypothetical protein